MLLFLPLPLPVQLRWVGAERVLLGRVPSAALPRPRAREGESSSFPLCWGCEGLLHRDLSL